MHKFLKIFSFATCLLSFSFTAAPVKKANTFSLGKYYDKNTMLDFSDSTATEINTYYGDVESKTGDELKVYLYSKIATHKADDATGKNYFLTYSQVSDWYKLTDRNWKISASVTPENFTLTKDNTYYLYNAYISDSANNDVTKAYSNYINGFKTDSSLTAIDYTNKKKPSNMIQVDKEHMWAKNHGFKLKDSSGKDIETKGAWTDMHHLVAADHNTNSLGHNDHFFGEVDHSTATVIKNYLADGTQEISGWLDTSSDTFEPTDEWKGDVARCLLYMGTRYSFKLDKNSQEEPYLYLTDDKTYTDDDANRADSAKIFHGVQYNLSTLLKWNEQDPVSDYEIHRNNLIYKNIQDNRNPYIDHPEWARRVYDTSYVYDASKEKGPTLVGYNKDSSDSGTTDKDSSSTQPDSSSTPDSSDSQASSNSSTQSGDFTLFNLTPKQTYILIIVVASVLLLLVILILVILIKHSNKKQRKTAKKKIQKAAKKIYKNKNNKKK